MKEEVNKQIIERWKAFRTKYIDENQGRAAKKLAISGSNLSMIESCQRPINFNILKIAVKHFRLNMEWLNSGVGTPQLQKQKSDINTDFEQLKLQVEVQHNMIKIMQAQIFHLYDLAQKDKKK